MNLPNRITIVRIVLTFAIIAILIFPFDAAGITTLRLFINESLVVDVKYLSVGVVFIIASLTDFVDGYVARKYNMVTPKLIPIPAQRPASSIISAWWLMLWRITVNI